MIPLRTLALVAALAAASASPAFRWPVPEGWAHETIPFPLGFAKELAFQGTEELRFAPGMFKPAEPGYWSYAFVWWLDGKPALDRAILERSLKDYFSGLSAEVGEEKGFAIDPARFNAKLREQPSAPKATRHPVQAYTGTVDSYDAFATGKPITLNLEVRVWDCAEAGKRVVMVLASPKPSEDAIWRDLHVRRDAFACH